MQVRDDLGRLAEDEEERDANQDGRQVHVLLPLAGERAAVVLLLFLLVAAAVVPTAVAARRGSGLGHLE